METLKEERHLGHLRENCHFNALAIFPIVILLVMIKAAEQLPLSLRRTLGKTCKRKCLPYGFWFEPYTMLSLACDLALRYAPNLVILPLLVHLTCILCFSQTDVLHFLLYANLQVRFTQGYSLVHKVVWPSVFGPGSMRIWGIRWRVVHFIQKQEGQFISFFVFWFLNSASPASYVIWT